MLIIFYVCTLIWSSLSVGTWDDDCAGRFFNTQKAFDDPTQFFGLWNRPLWVILFCIPVKFGTFSVPVIMGLFSVIGGYWLAKGLKNYGFNSYLSLLVIPFFLFQPYFYSVARNAMTEPLAAVIICGGFYFLSQQKYLPFAILGALLPLARVEMIPIVMLWGVILLMKKQYKYIFLLPLGVLLLDLVGYIFIDTLDSPTWFFDSILGQEKVENRYGHFNFNTYFIRYIYVISPIVFFFFIAGIVSRIKKTKLLVFDVFVYVQFLACFMLYTVFAWKLNVGNSAAFLRNLLPFSPLTAIIAVIGFRYLFPTQKVTKSTLYLLLKNLLFCSVILLITYKLFSVKLEMHHQRTDEFYGWNLIPMAIVSFLLLVYSEIKFRRAVYHVLLVLITGGTMAFCMVTESPKDFGVSPERTLVSTVSNVISKSSLSQNKIFCNHTWFHWSNNLEKNDTNRYENLTIENIEKAPVNSIVVWESHYSNRLIGNVPLTYFNGNNEFKLLFLSLSPDEKFNMQVYIKNKGVTNADLLSIYNDFILVDSNFLSIRLLRGNLLLSMNRIEEAKKDYQFIEHKKEYDTYDYYQMSRQYLYIIKDYSKAQQYLNNVVSNLKPESRYYNSAVLDLGTSYSYANMNKEAIQIYSALIGRDPSNQVAYVNRGINYYRSNELGKACSDFKTASAQGNQQAKSLMVQLNCN